MHGSRLHTRGAIRLYGLAASSRRYYRTVLCEQPSRLAIDLTPSPLPAITRISTACTWVNIDGADKAAILSQTGQFYFDGVVSITPVLILGGSVPTRLLAVAR